jgi:pimeloyl-ACP methyl ester carboxylesterase
MMRSIPRTRSSESLAAQKFHNQRAFQRLRGKLQLGIQGYKWVNIEVPNELWGAAALAIKLTGNGSKLARTASAHIAHALAPTIDPTTAEDYYPKSISEALDFSPKLTLFEDTACLVVSLVLTVLVYTRTTPATFSPLYALALAALCFFTLISSRSWLLERHFKAVQRSEKDLASSDSLFLKVNGVSLHYKKFLGGTGGGEKENSSPSTTTTGLATKPPVNVAIHCLHGFGASLYSWSMVQTKLATACRALVTSHDMPGFGLSQRPSWGRAYSLAFNGSAASRILDAELNKVIHITWEKTEEELTKLKTSDNNNGNGAAAHLASLSRSSFPKKVLIGHSMGGASAAEGVIRNPEDIAALVLVAPAIVAFWTGVPEAAKQQGPVAAGVALAEELVGADDFPGEILPLDTASSAESSTTEDYIMVDNESNTVELDRNTNNGAATQNMTSKTEIKHRQQHRSVGRVAAAVFHAITTEVFRFILVLATPFMVLLLRKLVRTRSFWERGLASAWYDKTKVSSQYVDAYRMGQLVHGWEYGIIRFMAARFSEKAGLWHAIASALDGDGHLSQAEKLAVACAQNNIKILIIHGKDDVLVPVANSKRLAKVIPGATFVEIENCGHMPQEEAPERFVHEVQKFIESL